MPPSNTGLPDVFDYFLNKTIRIQIVEMNIIDHEGGSINKEYRLMAECDGEATVTKPFPSLAHLNRERENFKGWSDFFKAYAAEQVEPDTIIDIRDASEMNDRLPEDERNPFMDFLSIQMINNVNQYRQLIYEERNPDLEKQAYLEHLKGCGYSDPYDEEEPDYRHSDRY